jgi:hypothetical protein
MTDPKKPGINASKHLAGAEAGHAAKNAKRDISDNPLDGIEQKPVKAEIKGKKGGPKVAELEL